MFQAPLRESVAAFWGVDAGRESQRFQVHANGHVAPKTHHLSEDAIFHTPSTEVRRERQSIWTGSDNRHVGFSPHRFLLLARAGDQAIN
jgi:hypothetical protein